MFNRSIMIMKRRRLLILSSILSLLLCVGTIELWVRSTEKPDSFHRQRGPDWSEIVSADGQLSWIKAGGLIVQHEPSAQIDSSPNEDASPLPSNWATEYLGGGMLAQFPGDGRLVTSATSLLPIVERFTFQPRRVFFGVTISRGNAYGLSFRVVSISYLLVLLICSLPLLVAALRLIQWWLLCQRDFVRRSRHQCVKCGYFTYSSPHQCPECGTPVKVA